MNECFLFFVLFSRPAGRSYPRRVILFCPFFYFLFLLGSFLVYYVNTMFIYIDSGNEFPFFFFLFLNSLCQVLWAAPCVPDVFDDYSVVWLVEAIDDFESLVYWPCSV